MRSLARAPRRCRGAGTSPRKSVYYGISQKHDGPAVRDEQGYKLILSSSGGGQGQWSPQQLPHVASSCDTNATYDKLSLLEGQPPLFRDSTAGDVLLYHLPTDDGERHALDVGKHEAIVARLRALAVQYEATKVPQLTGDPACPAFAPLASKEGRWIGPWCDGV